MECPAGKTAGGRTALTYELVRSKKEKKKGQQGKKRAEGSKTQINRLVSLTSETSLNATEGF